MLSDSACAPSRATPDFFSTMRIPLRAGRLLNESDNQQRDPPAVVINEAAARAFWPGRNPIGASARHSTLANDPFEVVGVVGDVRNSGLNRPAAPEIYVPAAVLGVNPMNVVVRSDLPADQLIAAVRRTIRQADPTLAMENVRTIHDIVLNTLQLERLSSLVMTFFGLAALVMATLGIYGVVSYFVRQRTVELGTRMALGAVNRDLVALVLGGGLKLALAGVAVGSIALVGAIPAARAVPRGRQLRMAAVCGVHSRGRSGRRGGRGGAGVAHDAPVADGRHSRAAAIGLAVGASADAASPFVTFARRSARTTADRRSRRQTC